MKSDNYYGMLNDIAKEPVLLQQLYDNRKDITAGFLKLWRSHHIKRMYLTGSGSPLYVGNVLKYAAIKLLGVDATSDPAMLLLNHIGFNLDTYQPDEIMLFSPAESGRAKGQVKVARKAKELGIPIVCTTWNRDGMLAGISDLVLLKPSREDGMPTTEGQVTAIYLGLLCFIEAALDMGRITQAEYDRYMLAMERVPAHVETNIAITKAWFEKYQNEVMGSPCYRMIAYGANIGTAEEASLKFTETHNRPSMFYELEECMHGPVVGLKHDQVMFVFCAEEGVEKERAVQLFHVMKEYSDNCYLVQSAQDVEKDPKGLLIQTDNVEFVNTIEYLIPMQMLAFMIADALGKDTGIHEPFAMMRKLETSYR